MIRLVCGGVLSLDIMSRLILPVSGHATTPSWIFFFPFLSVTKSLYIALTGLELLPDRLG